MTTNHTPTWLLLPALALAIVACLLGTGLGLVLAGCDWGLERIGGRDLLNV